MARRKDYYATLGIEESATADEVKKAYRRLARANHPDRNPDDRSAEERFKEVQEAYEVLSDPNRRRRYDRSRRDPFGGAFETRAGARFTRAPDGTFVREGPARDEDGGFGGLGDLFGRMFGASTEEPTRTVDPETEVRISFDEMIAGGVADVRLPDGRRVKVPYPRGMRDGYRVRLRGRGAGALYVRFRIAPHPEYRRDGRDLLASVRVNALEAMLGAVRSLTTPTGKKIRLTIPKGAQPGEVLRLRGQGIVTDEGTGDLLVEILVTVPRDLTPEGEQGLREAGERAGLL